MTEKVNIGKELKADFPKEAYSKDTSRGFELTSIKAAYIIERLNDVFGLCGAGWKYKYGEFTQSEKGEVLVSVKLGYKKEDGEWSEPIVSEGGKKPVNDNITDARKSAVTDGITKAASMLGVGHEAFKGLIKVGVTTKATYKPPTKTSEDKEFDDALNATDDLKESTPGGFAKGCKFCGATGKYHKPGCPNNKS